MAGYYLSHQHTKQDASPIHSTIHSTMQTVTEYTGISEYHILPTSCTMVTAQNVSEMSFTDVGAQTKEVNTTFLFILLNF